MSVMGTRIGQEMLDWQGAEMEPYVPSYESSHQILTMIIQQVMLQCAVGAPVVVGAPLPEPGRS